jgi:hypothetical protein
MKLSKVSWIFLIIGIVVIAGVGLGMTRSQQATQQKELTTKLAQSRQKFTSINNDPLVVQKDQLTEQVKTYTSQINAAKGKLVSADDNISSINRILDAAVSCNVEMVGITSVAKVSGSLYGTNCDTLSFTLNVKGEIEAIKNYVIYLSKVFPTSLVKTVAANSGEDAPTAGQEPEASPTPTPAPSPTPTPTPSGTPEATLEKVGNATINLTIYNYKGE